MTFPVFYISSIAFSGIGIFALWQLGLKRLMLDNFRDSLFITRDRLYALVREGRITCNDPAYRALELFINRTIRYAHRFTFLSFAFSVWHLETVKETASYSSQSRAMLEAVDAIKDESVKSELNALIGEVLILLPNYIARSSVMFMFGSLIYVAFRSVSPLIAQSKEKAVHTFEVEAYRDARFEGYASA
ncbi:MAG TPA: hypothetical protein VFC39_14555 [Acidobacteriaceae bacterium]|nr:hypothetical protein [Acidobacteriaceae bacterium]